ncbi:tyrosine-type recombinase/integrase [Cellulosilyticum sp. ST5]|uniref:tyrosine-type recombinase/integrase n=1 Tax=unclassified Cellulosilyticum TaxID=2643091 RepID=UPI000F8E2242|nr:tyrosine-type recombinase/integrase [Cellulosilyticum sp. WCF-2]QEH67277.1 tyrosine-type recombinase/integrase [Cellulosilyticum sp. WCF-2]
MGKTTQPIKDLDQELTLYDYLYDTDKMLYILVILIRYTGYRVGDLRCLKKRDVMQEYLEITENKTKYLKDKYERQAYEKDIRPKKPKPPRKVLIHPTLRKEIDEYTKDMKTWQVLFPSSRGRNTPMSYPQLNRRMKKVGEILNIKDFGFHAIRKTCFYNVYKESERIEEVQHFAGHKSPVTTSQYIGLTQEVNDNLVKDMVDPLKKFKR